MGKTLSLWLVASFLSLASFRSSMAGLAAGPGSAFFPSFLSQPPFLAPQGALVVVLVNSKAKAKTSPMEQVQLAPSKKGRSWKDRQNERPFLLRTPLTKAKQGNAANWSGGNY